MAKTAGLDVKTTELVARGSALPDVGQSDAVDAAVFELPAAPISRADQPKMRSSSRASWRRKDVTPAEIDAGRAACGPRCMNERRGRFFASYMTKAKQRMNIRINPETLATSDRVVMSHEL